MQGKKKRAPADDEASELEEDANFESDSDAEANDSRKAAPPPLKKRSSTSHRQASSASASDNDDDRGDSYDGFGDDLMGDAEDRALCAMTPAPSKEEKTH